jgi:carbon monoxide dehydrogenase subunit G
LVDIDVLGRIISDSKGLQEIGESRYQGKLPVKLGPLKGKVKTNVELADINEPNSFRLIVKGICSGVRLNGEGIFRLKERENVTTVRYTGNLRMGDGIPGFVKGEAKGRLQKALHKLFKKIEDQCCEELEHAH